MNKYMHYSKLVVLVAATVVVGVVFVAGSFVIAQSYIEEGYVYIAGNAELDGGSEYGLLVLEGKVGIHETSPESKFFVADEYMDGTPTAAGIHMGSLGAVGIEIVAGTALGARQPYIDFHGLNSYGTDYGGRLLYTFSDTLAFDGAELHVDQDLEIQGDLTLTGQLLSLTRTSDTALAASGCGGASCSANTQVVISGGSATSTCALEHVHFREIDDTSEQAACWVYENGGDWITWARADLDAYALCESRCLTW